MILVVNDYDGLYSPFWAHLGTVTHDESLLFREPEEIKLVCFTGGADVSPKLYGHKNLQSSINQSRDEREVLIFKMAHKHKIPMTGICRGSQFLNVMCGGTMVQHLRKSHGGSYHRCYTYDGQEFEVSSSHHQMSVPGPDGALLASASMTLDPKDVVYGGSFKDLAYLYDESGRIRITEALAYPKINVFAVQHHPEWQDIDQEAPQWTLQKIRELCWGEGQLTLEVAPRHA